jgi:hypothetical protein
VEVGEIERVSKGVYRLSDADAAGDPGVLQDAKILHAQEASA